MTLSSNALGRVHKYTKNAQEWNLGPLKYSPPPLKGAAKQSGEQGLLQGKESHKA